MLFQLGYFYFHLSNFYASCRCRLKGTQSRPDKNRNGDEGLSFYYPRLLCCLDRMLAVIIQRTGLQFIQWRRSRNLIKERDPFVHGRMELPKTSPQAIELNPSPFQ